jgi:hypothetical protein
MLDAVVVPGCVIVTVIVQAQIKLVILANNAGVLGEAKFNGAVSV